VFLSCKPAQVSAPLCVYGLRLNAVVSPLFLPAFKLWVSVRALLPHIRATKILSTRRGCVLIRGYSVELSRSGRGEFTTYVTVITLVGLVERDAHMRRRALFTERGLYADGLSKRKPTLHASVCLVLRGSLSRCIFVSNFQVSPHTHGRPTLCVLSYAQ
jgi:hypothetical protein